MQSPLSLSLFIKSTMLMISSDVYQESPLSLFIKSTMLMISSNVYPESPVSLFMKSTMLMISSDVYPDSPLSLFIKSTMLMISSDVYPDSLLSLFSWNQPCWWFRQMSIQIPFSLSFHKMSDVDDLVRCLSRFPSVSLFIKSTMLTISLDVYPDFPLSLF